MEKSWTRGQIIMELASILTSKGVEASLATHCAIDSVRDLKVPEYWREMLGDGASDAIDGDLAAMKEKGQIRDE